MKNKRLNKMLKRYIQIKDKNGVPVYEGDKLSFDVEQLSQRTSKIGQFIQSLQEQDIVGELEIQESYPEVKIHIKMKFKRSSGEYVKNATYDHYFDITGREDEAADDYVLDTDDQMFNRYLFGVINNDMEIVSPIEDTRSEELDENEFRYKLGEEYLPLNKVIVLEKTQELEEKFKDEEKLIASGEYTHFAMRVVKREDFRTHACFYFSNENGDVVCERKTTGIKDECYDDYYKESDRLEKIERKAYQVKRNKISDLNDDESLSEEEKLSLKEAVRNEYESKVKELQKSLKEYGKRNQIWKTEPYDDIIIAFDNAITLKFVVDLMKKTEYKIIEK